MFAWNFPLLGTYWVGADVAIQALAKREGGLDKLKGKKITLVYHDSPYGKEPIALLQERAKTEGFTLTLLPVAHPGVEQKATWLQIRQNRPDYVLLWGWGVMNSTALKEAQATGFPRDKMYGIWWAGAEPDVKDVADGAKGYNALALQHSAEPQSKIVTDVLDTLYAKGQGSGEKADVGSVLYMRGLISAMLGVEGVRKAQERYGKGKVMTGAGAWRTSSSTRKCSTRWASLASCARCRPPVWITWGHPGCASSRGTAASGWSARSGTRPTTNCCVAWC